MTDQTKLQKEQCVKNLTNLEKKFAEEYVENGGHPDLAAKEIFGEDAWKDDKQIGRRMLVKPRVAMYVSFLRRELASRFFVGREMITEELIHNIQHSRANGSLTTHRKALMDLAKLHGLVVEKSDVNTHHSFQVMKDVVIDGEVVDFNVGSPSIDTAENPINNMNTAFSAAEQAHISVEDQSQIENINTPLNDSQIENGELSDSVDDLV